MLQTLGDPIIPIFAVMALGYLFQKAGLMTTTHAEAINRFVFYIAAPSLGISVIGNAEPGAINWPPVLLYFGAQMVTYVTILCLMRFVYNRDLGEALLLGMTAVFANHIFFVLPISEQFYDDARANMAGLVLLDISVIFVGTVLLAEVVTGGGNFRATIGNLLPNPFIYAPPAGILLGLLGPAVPSGVWTFLNFTSAAAAPVVLFSLGITLAASPIFPIRLPCWTVTAGKLLLMPALVLTGQTMLPDSPTATITLLVAAGPCGTLPYVIATQYGIRTVSIAKTVLISTILSMISLAILLP